jgi:purine-binding chemotaxis protein CheW
MNNVLIFDLDNALFGVDATQVLETVWLPELTPVEEAPFCVVGMFSLRDRLVPVTDLYLRFGHPARPYTINDQVVVLEMDQQLMGLIVSEVRIVVELTPEAIRPALNFDPETHTHLITGEAQVGSELVTLLDVSQLVHLSQNLSSPEHPVHRFCPDATPEQHALYLSRARALLAYNATEEGTPLAVAVVELAGEYFGIELESVQEFSDIAPPCPIPCCPPHILGAINLNGNLITLFDLRIALNLPHATPCGGKMVLARTQALHGMNGTVVGVAVDEVHDVVYLRQEALQPVPTLLHELKEIKGAAPYNGKMMMVLDLQALLAREQWRVNETV